MIVLAIVGVITLVVFLAVPSLQRSSRNVQRRNDVRTLLAAVSSYQSNNLGSLPLTGQFSTKFAGSYDSLGYYTTDANIQWNYVTSRGGGPWWPSTNQADSVTVYNYLRCQDVSTPTTTGANVKTVVALFFVETSSGLAGQCIEA
jgi:type II secretory pathway pseudopilin PulG